MYSTCLKFLFESLPSPVSSLSQSSSSTSSSTPEPSATTTVLFPPPTKKIKNALNRKNKDGNTPAHVAAMMHRYDILDYIGQHAPTTFLELNKDGTNAFCIVLECLINKKNIDAAECVRTIAKYCPDTLCRMLANGLNMACYMARIGWPIMLRLISEYAPSELVKEIGDRETPMSIAVMYGRLTCVQFLVSLGDKFLDTTTKGGYTMAHIAASHGQVECLDFLASSSKKLLTKPAYDGMVAAHAAVYNNCPECIAVIAKHCPESFQIFGYKGMQAAHYASGKGRTECLALILQHCPSTIFAKDSSDNTPLARAMLWDRYECFKVIMEHCEDGEEFLAQSVQDGSLPVEKIIEMRKWSMSNTLPSISLECSTLSTTRTNLFGGWFVQMQHRCMPPLPTSLPRQTWPFSLIAISRNPWNLCLYQYIYHICHQPRKNQKRCRH